MSRESLPLKIYKKLYFYMDEVQMEQSLINFKRLEIHIHAKDPIYSVSYAFYNSLKCHQIQR